jgi:erythrocyte band 7 integral membrane protein
MQIRYLEAMQAMAKTANSKVIFLPAQNQTVQSALAQADAFGEGPSSYKPADSGPMGIQSSDGFQSAINSHVIENM